jgi:pyruvate dehydrogenase E1 component beta subunit
MAMLAEDPRTVFMGQAVACEGTAMSKTFRDVPVDRLVELPVAEDMQMGMAIGASLAGLRPVCCYPRINFLLLAINQLVLHLDKLPLYSNYRPRVIVRTSIATPEPLHPGEQHLGDFTDAIRNMLRTVKVVRLEVPDQIAQEYRAAAARDGSTLLVERMGRY